MDAGLIVTALSALGAGSILTKLVDQLIARRQGRLAEERGAWAERDREAKARRMLEEALHLTRITAIARGVPEDELPDWPTYSTTSGGTS